MAMETISKPKVLLVDDERLLLRCLTRFLRRICEIFTAESYDQAVEIMQREQLDAVVSDCRMPGRDGADVLCVCLMLQPDTLRIMYSSDPPPNLEHLEQSGIVEHFFEKPGHNELFALLETLTPRILDKAS